jgi:hypothetical protein
MHKWIYFISFPVPDLYLLSPLRIPIPSAKLAVVCFSWHQFRGYFSFLPEFAKISILITVNAKQIHQHHTQSQNVSSLRSRAAGFKEDGCEVT